VHIYALVYTATLQSFEKAMQERKFLPRFLGVHLSLWAKHDNTILCVYFTETSGAAQGASCALEGNWCANTPLLQTEAA
jgi:hypothetical protein